MTIDFTPDLINAFANLVVVLDQHPLGGVTFIMAILASGASLTFAKRNWK